MARPDATSNPFPGLRPYRPDEEYLFFGRERQVDAMVDTLSATHFLAVVGTSGSGKSSLVNCGLRPALHRGLMASAGSSWRVAQFRPGGDPIASLARSLAEEGVLFDQSAVGGLSMTELVSATLRMSRVGLLDIFEQAHLPAGTNLLLVVDQFEELFRYRGLATDHGAAHAAGDGAAAFVDLLLAVAEQAASNVYVVLTMRSDFLGDCAQFPGLAEAINVGQYLVPRMNRDERRAAIAGPVGVGRAVISPTLVTRLVNDVGDSPDQLPILQHALNRTWARWEAGGDRDAPIELAHYEAVGGMRDALDHHAEEVFAELATERAQLICERLFKALTDTANDVRGVRRPTRFDDLRELTGATDHELTEVIDAFRRPDRSFLMPPAHEPLRDDTVVDISHESLMRVWKRLGDWADEEAASARQYVRLAQMAEGYEAKREALLRNPNLALFSRWWDESEPNPAWAARYDPNFDRAAGFLRRSQRRNRLRRILAGGAVVLLVVGVVVFAVVADRARKAEDRATIAQRQAEESAARALAGSATVAAADNPGLALALAAESLASAPTPATVRRADNALVTARGAFANTPAQPVRGALVGHDAAVEGVAFNHDRGLLASASEDGTVRLWNPETGEQVGRPLVGHEQKAFGVAFDDDGTVLASTGDDNTIRLWNPATGELLRTLEGHDGDDADSPTKWVTDVAFNHDGTVLVSGGEDRTLHVWDVAAGTLLHELEGHEDTVRSVAFNHDGTLVASAGADRTVRVWDPNTATMLHVLEGHEGVVRSVAFSPDGTQLASGGADNTVRLWDPTTGEPAGEPLRQPEEVRGLAYNHDGTRLASASDDGTVQLWDPTAGEPAGAPLVGHEGSVNDVAFSRDGARLAAAGGDGTVRLWATEIDQPGRIELRHDADVQGIAFRPDGEMVATASSDSKVRLWDLTSGGLVGTLEGHGDEAVAVVFNHDGTLLASASRDDTIRLWDPATLEPAGDPLTGHDDNVNDVAFSPDGATLASVSHDMTVRLWNPITGEQLRVLQGHEDTVRAVTFNHDGTLVASAGDDNTVRVWDPATGELTMTLTRTRDDVQTVAFSPDGTLLASGGGDEIVRLWDVATGEPAVELAGHTDWVADVAFSPDGRFVVSAGFDGTVRVWDPAAGEQVGGPLGGHTDTVRTVAFSRDGALLASAGTDDTMFVWDRLLEPSVACALAGPYVTLDHVQEFLADGMMAAACELS